MPTQGRGDSCTKTTYRAKIIDKKPEDEETQPRQIAQDISSRFSANVSFLPLVNIHVAWVRGIVVVTIMYKIPMIRVILVPGIRLVIVISAARIGAIGLSGGIPSLLVVLTLPSLVLELSPHSEQPPNTHIAAAQIPSSQGLPKHTHEQLLSD